VDGRGGGEADAGDHERNRRSSLGGESEASKSHQSDREVDAWRWQMADGRRHRVIARSCQALRDDDRRGDRQGKQRDER
jgi:hypothetical protein